jgi:hypothetical protein
MDDFDALLSKAANAITLTSPPPQNFLIGKVFKLVYHYQRYARSGEVQTVIKVGEHSIVIVFCYWKTSDGINTDWDANEWEWVDINTCIEDMLDTSSIPPGVRTIDFSEIFDDVNDARDSGLLSEFEPEQQSIIDALNKSKIDTAYAVFTDLPYQKLLEVIREEVDKNGASQW